MLMKGWGWGKGRNSGFLNRTERQNYMEGPKVSIPKRN